jgi:SAM-dependent methyltransferase
MRIRREAQFLLGTVLLAAAVWAQGTHPRSGRRIAPVMGAGGADWLERSERIQEENPGLALDKIGIRKGEIVADVGAGSGYYTALLAARVGPAGKVYANDVQPEMLDILRDRIRREKLTNVVPVLGSESDPHLPDGAFDLILMVDVYHEFAQPQRMLQKLKSALKPSGRLVLLEYRKEDPYVPIRPEHKMSVAEAKLEVEGEGFLLDKVLEDLPWQHILIFRPKK